MTKIFLGFTVICHVLIGENLGAERSPSHETSATRDTRIEHTAIDNCSLEGLINSCKIFGPDRPRLISLPDGSIVRNFSSKMSNRQPQEEAPAPGLRNPKQERTSPVEAFKAKVEILSLLGGGETPKKNIGSFISHISAFSDSPLGEALLRPRGNIIVPWPATQSKLSEVSALTVRNFLKNEVLQKDEEKWKQLSQLLTTLHPAPPATVQSQPKPQETPQEKEAALIYNKAEERKTRVLGLIETARKSLINSIRSGREDSQLTSSELKAIAKVSTVTVIPPAKAWNSLECEEPLNAFYRSMSHSVTLCPEIYALPEIDVLSIISHELSHSIDPCNFQTALIKVDVGKSRQWAPPPNERGIIVETAASAEVMDLGYTLGETETGYSTYPFEFDFSPKAADSLEMAGAIEIEHGKTHFSSYPFKDVFDCLSSKAGGEFGATAPPLSESIARVEKHRTSHGLPMTAEQKNLLKTALGSYPNCDPRGSNRETKVNEAFAEWSAAQAVGSYLKSNKITLNTESERITPYSKIFSSFCATFKEKQGDRERRGELVAQFFNDLYQTEGAHPSAARRIMDIFLRNPDIRNSLGCKGKGLSQCEHKQSTPQ